MIAVDDAHWADEGFLELLEATPTCPACPLLVVCTARPEIAGLRPDLGAADGRQRLALRPLTAAATEELAAQLVDGARPGAEPRIAETSGGNPFFAEEIAHAVGAGAAPPGRPCPTPSRRRSPSRSTLSREREKRTLQLAAVLGERFRGGGPDRAAGRTGGRGAGRARAPPSGRRATR